MTFMYIVGLTSRDCSRNISPFVRESFGVCVTPFFAVPTLLLLVGVGIAKKIFEFMAKVYFFALNLSLRAVT